MYNLVHIRSKMLMSHCMTQRPLIITRSGCNLDKMLLMRQNYRVNDLCIRSHVHHIWLDFLAKGSSYMDQKWLIYALSLPHPFKSFMTRFSRVEDQHASLEPIAQHDFWGDLYTLINLRTVSVRHYLWTPNIQQTDLQAETYRRCILQTSLLHKAPSRRLALHPPRRQSA